MARNTNTQSAKRNVDSKMASLPAAIKPVAPMPGIELFFGLVGPTGTNLDSVCDELSNQLAAVGYRTEIISLSSLISAYSELSFPPDNAYSKIKALMNEGTRLREKSRTGDFVAKLALVEIVTRRESKTGAGHRPAEKTAYILRSFKRREEVELFRTIYGKAFNLISIYSSLEDRLDSLSNDLARAAKQRKHVMEHKALELINIDANEEGKELGQNVRETFPLADYFVTLKDPSLLRDQLKRFVELVFENPYITPTKDEYSMFLAQAAALRSSDLARQVGAVIVSQEGEVLATGCNEVPKAGGGLYWAEDEAPRRDVELGYDKNSKIKRELVEELFYKLSKAKWLDKEIGKKSSQELYSQATMKHRGVLYDSQILDVIEFGRSVHAEMAAITDASKRGVSVKGARLFCTTFPCHLCARHLVSSGLAEVIYIEPYPKSRTEELYSDSIAVNPKHSISGLVNFFPFVGVAPRRYFDFFQLFRKRKNDDGDIVNWKNEKKEPRVKRFVLSYIMLEMQAIGSLPTAQI